MTKSIWTWSWEAGWCIILVDGQEVAQGQTMAEALQILGDLLRRAETEAKARGGGE